MAARPQPMRSGLSGTSPIAPPAPPAPEPAGPAPSEAPTGPTATVAPPVAAPAPAPTSAQPAAATETSSASPKTPARDKSRPGRSARTSATKNTGGAVTARKWDEYEAKTARLRPDQRLQLTMLARQLTVAKKGVGEKITDNTLIRVAVDILLAESPRLLEDNEDGPLTTEQEIRLKLGLTS